MTAILNQVAEKWFSWELSMFWQVGVLIIIVAGLDLLIRKWAWPQVRYALWLLILVKLILPPSLTSPTSFTAEIPFMVKQAAIKINQPQTPPRIIEPVEPVTETMPIVPQSVEIISDSSAPAATSLSVKTYVFFVWLGGVAVLTGWLIIRLSNLRREHLKDQLRLPERLEDLLASTARKLGLKKVPQIILTNKVCCPAVFGIFKPVLLMPADKLQNLTSQDAENIFLHELAHIKRGDLFVHAIYMILQIAYWFNPLLWLIRKHLQNLRELCCDATVARMLREKTAGYRQTLLETARQLLAQPVDPGLGLLGLFENSSWLLDRLHWLEKKSWRYRPLRIATVFVLICLMTACVLPMAKFEAPVDFIIKGTVTDAQTGKPIAGAKVGDVERYAEGKQYTTTDANGNYSYKTWYEEHAIKCEADGYKKQVEGLLTKFIGSEKEKVINFELKPNFKATELTENKEIKKTDKQDDFKITLSNGTTVELLAVSNYPHNSKAWQPDGSNLQKSPLFIKPTENGRKDNVGFAIKVDGPQDLSLSYGPVKDSSGHSGSTNVINKDGEKLEGYKSLTALIPDEQISTSITLGISTVPWETLATHTGKGGTTTGSNMIIFSQAFETKDSAAITISTKCDRTRAERVVAIDNDGQTHTPQGQSSLASNDLDQITVEFRDMQLKDIKEFQFQVRPYEWVEFKNVSLKPGFKTDVQIGTDMQAGSSTGEDLQKPAGQDEGTSKTNDASANSVPEKNIKTAKALRITVYEGNDVEPETSVRIPLVAMKIVRQLLPPKDKLQIIAQKIKLDESLPEGLDSNSLIDMLDGMLKQVDQGIEATTLLEVKDGTERVKIVLE